MPDGDATLFRTSDLKQYIYCPRILYYHVCLPHVRPVTYKMQAGSKAHESEHKRALRRTMPIKGLTIKQRYFDVIVQSANLGLSGQIDEVIVTTSHLIPVDYKLARKAGEHFKTQLTAYALLLEDRFAVKVKYGLLYLIPLRQAVEVKITSTRRQSVKQALDAMKRIAAHEHMPPPTPWRQRCVECEFRRFCNDI